jgi:hypothetical protein
MIDLSLNDFDRIKVEDCDEHVVAAARLAGRHYHTVNFIKDDVVVLRLNLHFSNDCKDRLAVLPFLPRFTPSANGPFLLPDEYGTTTQDSDVIYIDWHWSDKAHEVIEVRSVSLYGRDTVDLDTLTEEQHEAIVRQVMDYLEAHSPDNDTF